MTLHVSKGLLRHTPKHFTFDNLTADLAQGEVAAAASSIVASKSSSLQNFPIGTHKIDQAYQNIMSGLATLIKRGLEEVPKNNKQFSPLAPIMHVLDFVGFNIEKILEAKYWRVSLLTADQKDICAHSLELNLSSFIEIPSDRLENIICCFPNLRQLTLGHIAHIETNTDNKLPLVKELIFDNSYLTQSDQGTTLFLKKFHAVEIITFERVRFSSLELILSLFPLCHTIHFRFIDFTTATPLLLFSKFKNTQRIHSLEFFNCYGVTDQLIDSIRIFKEIVAIVISRANGFTGTGFQKWLELKKLRFLSVSNCGKIKKENLLFLSKLPLMILNLSNTNLSDAGVAIIAEAKSITNLNLSRTDISSKGLHTLLPLSNLKILKLAYNLEPPYTMLETNAGDNGRLSRRGLERFIKKAKQLKTLYLDQEEVRVFTNFCKKNRPDLELIPYFIKDR